MNKRKKRKITQLRSYLIMVFIIAIAVVIQSVILSNLNQSNAERTATVLINQVRQIIEDNRDSTDVLVDDLKEEYITNAQTVAYILKAKPSAVKDPKELRKIADMMGLDEIHIFDKTGRIYAGTVESYYGMSFDSGEQIGYFTPMLFDRKKSMCQDVTPNTAEGKNMMYAITWAEDGSKMVQVGVEPVRLLNEMKKNEATRVIENIPTYEGVTLYMTSQINGMILGSSDRELAGHFLNDIGMPVRHLEDGETQDFVATIDTYRAYCKYHRVGDYIIVVVYSTQAGMLSFVVSIAILFVYLLIAGALVVLMINRAVKANEAKNEQLAVLTSMSGVYNRMFVIDLDTDLAYEYSTQLKPGQKQDVTVASTSMRKMMDLAIVPEYGNEARAFTELSNLSERMQNKKIITAEVISRKLGWIRMSFITIETDEENRPKRVIYVIRSIDAEKKKEETLIHKSNTDELTGFLNRHAYEDSIKEHHNYIEDEDFVYVSIDVNGLKVANDTLGHEAGDELILGACECMRACLEPYGAVYRMGGDEFAAILFANETQLAAIKENFETTLSKWHGRLVESVSCAAGYVVAKEESTTMVTELAKIADKRMYEEKGRYYQKKGVDRRGQRDAHTALCNLYTRILKVNATTDCYQVINSKESDMTVSESMLPGYSKMVYEFASNGGVLEEDISKFLEETSAANLRIRFAASKEEVIIGFRRRYGTVYKQSILEIIPASDYDDDNCSLFIYVKQIEK